MQHTGKRVLSILLSAALLTGVLATGQLNSLAYDAPTKENATTYVATNKANYDANNFSLSSPVVANSAKEGVIRLEENQLRYFAGGDWFALKKPVKLADVKRVTVNFINQYPYPLVPIVIDVFDEENELQAFAAGMIDNYPSAVTLESRYAALTAAGVDLPETGNLYFATACPTRLDITQITIEYTDGNSENIPLNTENIEIVTASRPGNLTSAYYYKEVQETAVAEIYPETQITIPNVDLRNGLNDIKIDFTTLSGPVPHPGDGTYFSLWGNTEMWMDVYAISKTADGQRQYRIGKVTLPAYFTGGYVTAWQQDPAAFNGCSFTWDNEAYRDLFTGEYDIKLVYKCATPTNDSYYINLYGVYFYADGESSNGQLGADPTNTLLNLVTTAEGIQREDVSSDDTVWNAFQSQLDKTKAYTTSQYFGKFYEMKPEGGTDDDWLPKNLGDTLYNLPRIYYHSQALTNAINALTFSNESAATFVATNKTNYDNGLFSLNTPVIANGAKEGVIRLEENQLRYFASGDWFALKKPVNLADVKQVQVNFINQYPYPLVPFVIDVFDKENELQAFAGGQLDNYPSTVTLESRYAALSAAGIDLPETGNLYFATACPTRLDITQITIEYNDGTSENIPLNAENIEIVTASRPGNLPNAHYYKEVQETAVAEVYPEAQVTLSNVDLRNGLDDIKVDFTTLAGPGHSWWSNTELWMDVYAISKTAAGQRQYRIGKISLPAYNENSIDNPAPWAQNSAALAGCSFTWDNEAYRDIFTGVYDIKLVYKCATPTNDSYYINLYGVYLYADGDASNGQLGADPTNTLLNLVTTAEGIQREDVSSDDTVWNAFRSQLDKTKAYTASEYFGKFYEMKPGISTDDDWIPKNLGDTLYNLPRIYSHSQALANAINTLAFYADDFEEKVANIKATYTTQGDYTDETWTALQSAITAADALLGQSNPASSDVRTAINKLDTATGNLKTYAAVLAETLTAAKTAYPNQGHVTDETWPLFTAAIAAAEAADTTDARKAAITGLEDAMGALETYTALLAADVARAEADYSAQSHYTDESWQGLTAAIAAGKAAQTVEEEKAAITGLANAIGALETYTVLLNDAIHQAETTYPAQNDYTDASWQALSNALDLSRNAESAAQEKAALTQLTAAIAGLQTYTNELNAIMAQIEEEYPEKGLYTDETWQALTSAVKAAKAATTPEARKAAITELETAVNGLRTYRDNLADVVRETEQMYADQGIYTNESWIALLNAISTAKDLLAKDAVTRQELDGAIQGLDEAIAGLSSYFDLLDEEVQQAWATYSAQGNYANSSWITLLNAIAQGEATLANPDATAEQFQKALNDLATAIEGLGTDKPTATPPSASGDGTDDDGEDFVQTGVAINLAIIAAVLLSGVLLWLTRKRRSAKEPG